MGENNHTCPDPSELCEKLGVPASTWYEVDAVDSSSNRIVNKLWIATMGRLNYEDVIFPTSVVYDIDDTIDDLLTKIHNKLHVEFRNFGVSRLFIFRPDKDAKPIKRDTLVVDALKQAKEAGLKNSIDCPFIVKPV